MKVLYDYKVFMAQRFGGVSKGLCEFISHRPKEMDYEIAIKKCNNEHLIQAQLVKDLLPASLDREIFCRKFGNIRGIGRLYSLMLRMPLINMPEKENMAFTIETLKRGDYDVFHSTTINSTYFYKYLNGKPLIYTVHDMTQEKFPQYFGTNPKITALKRDLCGHAAAVITASGNSKKDLIEILGIPEEKIHVVYRGGPKHVEIKSAPIMSGEYFLFVGQRQGYKNFRKTLEDFRVFHNNHRDVKLVCTARPFTVNEKKHIEQLGLQNDVIQMSVSDEGLKNLYTYAVAFIFPSLYEGFGLPTLEALAQGCPCLLNDNSCFPEVGGNAAFYFKSDGTTSNLPSVMEEVYGLTSEERKAVIEKGYEQLRKFSWEEASKKLCAVYKSVI